MHIVPRHGRAIKWLVLLLLLVGIVALLRLLPVDAAVSCLERQIEQWGYWGPFFLGLVYVSMTLLLFPAWILTVTAGAVYGLLVGTVTASLASTTAAGLAFLIARHFARERVSQRIQQSIRLAAVDEAIGRDGWKIVALLRLSPIVPFNLQNYLYGVTAMRFWPCLLTSWIAMLPGTFLYVYLGSIGRAAADGDGRTSKWEWVLRGVGILATFAVTVFIARLARREIEKKTQPKDLQNRTVDIDAQS